MPVPETTTMPETTMTPEKTAMPEPTTTPEKKADAISAAIAELQVLLGGRLSTSAAVREQHGKDESWFPGHDPDAVAFPNSTEDVAAIVRICAKFGAPIIPFGEGTSLEGHVAALEGGICISLANMKKIVAVNAADMDVTVQAGVTRKQLNEHLRDTGLFFPIDPGADASLGGMTATRASGTNAVRYGTMRENVLSLTVVMADGQIIRTARRARKSSAGYDLTRLIVGSEGTLGVITEVTVRLYGIPAAILAGVLAFDSLEGAVESVILTIQSGIPVARIELVDEESIKAINDYSKLDLPVSPTLFLEFHGTEASVAEQAELFREIADDHGGGEFQSATRTEDRNKLWQARHDSAYAAMTIRPGCKVFASDVCVPISRLAECIHETKKDLDEIAMPTPILGHVGDGNFHVVFVVDPDSEQDMADAKRINRRLITRALAMDGTCTGEHGIGHGKMDYLIAEHGAGVAYMRLLKTAFDPQNIMNPGKILRI
jgi:D-lactate dehydrogenase (cytochrome)